MRKFSDFGLARSDRWILGSSVVAVIVSSLMLWQDGWLRKWAGFTSKSGTPLGKVTMAAQDVRRRTRTSLAWIPVESNEVVFENDSLFTGEESEAVIHLDKIGEMTLSSNSLVILRRSRQDLLLDLQLGRFRTQLAQGQALHVLQSGAVAVIESKSSESIVNLHRDRQGKLSVAPLQGEVEMRLNDKGNVANPQQSLESVGRELQTRDVALALRSPVGGRRLWVAANDPVKFEWDVVAGSNQARRIRIAKSDTFKGEAVVDEVPSSSYSTRELIDEGVYYWRVETQESGEWKPASALGEFTLLKKVPPQPLFPYQGFNIVSKTGPARLELKWQEKRGVESYRVQLSTDAEFSQLIVDQESPSPRVTGVELAQGNYFWRVRAEGTSPIANVWSPVAAFSVNRQLGAPDPVVAPVAQQFEDELKPEDEVAVGPETTEAKPLPETEPTGPTAESKPSPQRLEVPVISTQTEEVTLEFPSTEDRSPASLAQLQPTNAPRLQWKKVEGAQTYELEIADNSEFSGKKIYLGSKSDLAVWKDAQPGQYYWRIRARQGDSTSEFSAGKPLKIELPPPVVKASESVASEGDSTRVSHLWKWQAVPRATGYEVVTSDQEDFGGSASHKVKDAQLKVELDSGAKYLKVAALGSQDRRVSGFSSVGVVKVVNQLKLVTPRVVRPENGLTIISFGSGSNPVAFGWREVENAKTYRIQFSNSEDFAELVMEKILSETDLVLSSEDFEGQIYWRMRSESGKAVSGWSPVRHFKSEKK
ncbi:MAG: hypothetical protein IT288_03805 [Bdellovibrionales bacterium]|nr:hypothetical protein [Bdellovibrionales bacterium]